MPSDHFLHLGPEWGIRLGQVGISLLALAQVIGPLLDKLLLVHLRSLLALLLNRGLLPRGAVTAHDFGADFLGQGGVSAGLEFRCDVVQLSGRDLGQRAFRLRGRLGRRLALLGLALAESLLLGLHLLPGVREPLLFLLQLLLFFQEFLVFRFLFCRRLLLAVFRCVGCLLSLRLLAFGLLIRGQSGARLLLRVVGALVLRVRCSIGALIAGVVMWIFMSDLRFQSDAAVLLSFMLIVNAIAAVLIVPSWCVVFKPKFVTAAHYDEDGVLET